jgi:DNA (cytosine-5)-methyltransferase 1
MAKKPTYKFIDLFAGIGGFHVAFNNTKRAQCVFASEWDPAARKTYRHNFNHGADKALFANDDKYFQGDITKVDPKSGIPDFDILCGGFPCQPFSQVGQKKGFSDTRGTLFFNVEEIIRVKQPAAFFLENVRGLITHGGPSEIVPGIGKTMETILNHLFGDKESGGLGYHKPKGTPGYFYVKASDFGVPQHRPRVFIIGFKSKQRADAFVIPTRQKLDEMRLGEILGGEVFFDEACKKRKSIGFTLRCGGKGSHIDDRRNWEHYRVLKRGCSEPEVVKVNERQGLDLNGFPESYEFPSDVAKAARMKQLGNSVAVTAVEAWGQAIIAALDTSPIRIGSVKVSKAANSKRKKEGKLPRKSRRKKYRKKKR